MSPFEALWHFNEYLLPCIIGALMAPLLYKAWQMMLRSPRDALSGAHQQASPLSEQQPPTTLRASPTSSRPNQWERLLEKDP